MKTPKLSILPLLIFLFVLLVSCDTEDPFSFEPPDFSTVPEPYDTSSVESVDLSRGVSAYIHEEGHGAFNVTVRDQLSIFITLRSDEGDVIYSSFANSNTNPVTISVINAGNLQPSDPRYSVFWAYSPGLKVGLLGMKPGERRTIVVPPNEGFQSLPDSHINGDYKENTLIYNIRISAIGPSKSQ